MKHRSPLAVFVLSFITLGIYGIVWHVKTKNEMNAMGATIPTAWLLIVPFANWYWLWKYCEGVEHVTGGQTSGVLAFVILFLLGIIGMAIIQSEFNKVGATVAAPGASPQPFAAPGMPQPDNSFGGSPAVAPGAAPLAPAVAAPPDVAGPPQPPQTV